MHKISCPSANLSTANFTKLQQTSAWLWQQLTCYKWNLKLFSKPWHSQLQKAQTNFNLHWRTVTFEPEVLERSCLQFQKAGEFRAFTLMTLAFALMSRGTNISTNVIQTSVIFHQKHFALVTLHHSFIKKPKYRKNYSSSAKRHKMALSRASLFYTIIWENAIINLFRPS